PINFQKEEEKMKKSIAWVLVCLVMAIGLSACGASGLTNNGATLSSIAVTPANPTIAVGANKQFTAIGTYSDNSTKNLTELVIWTSSDANKANISNAGMATGVAAGTTVMKATLGGVVTGTTTLTVS